jgi:hypothetical protein
MTIPDDAAVSVMKYTYHDRMLSWRNRKRLVKVRMTMRREI